MESSDPSLFAAQLVAIEVISELLVSTTPQEFSEALTNHLRELSGAKTVMVLVHSSSPAQDTLLHVSPARRADLFSQSELDLFCRLKDADVLMLSSAALPMDHPFRPALLSADVQSMVRLSLRAGGELVGNLLLFDLLYMDSVAETIRSYICFLRLSRWLSKTLLLILR